jgi:anti-sigma-K factor RskA
VSEPADIHEQAAAYVMDALDDVERRAFEAHLDRCTVCKEELESLRSAAVSLAYAGPAPAPPPSLRERILEAARSEQLAEVIPLRRRVAVPSAITLAAAAACAAVALGLWASSLSGRLDRERSARQGDAQALAVMATPGARRYTLLGAKGSLVVSPDQNAALVVAGLPQAPSGKTYEAWVVRNRSPVPAGLFKGGSSQSIFALTRPVPRGSRVAVSLERAGGSKTTPTQLLFASQTTA